MSMDSAILKNKAAEADEIIRQYLFPQEGLLKTLAEACNYSVLAGGKRLRPIIMKASYEAFGGNGPEIGPFMAAIEMIHSFSLVHDDLPCMDNDEFRRGKPTTWKQYGYAMAVLAGDELSIAAFETAAKAADLGGDAARVIRALSVLAQKAGLYGMMGGQSLDVERTGEPLTKEELNLIYRQKTGALLEASMMIGCILAGGTEEQAEECGRIASLVGMGFQIRDDILDETATTEQLGKPVGSDRKNEKTTYVTAYGLERSGQFAAEYTKEAVGRLSVLLPEDTFLKELFLYLIDREF